MQLARDFRQFLLRGNVVDLAVAIVVGAAFTAVVSQFVESLLTPLIAAIYGKPDFSGLTFTVNESVFTYGAFLNALISFVIVAAVVFFLVVRPVNMLVSLSRKQDTPDPTTTKCPECLSEIPIEARRCAYCTAILAEAGA